jgi:hypothetical protein
MYIMHNHDIKESEYKSILNNQCLKEYHDIITNLIPEVVNFVPPKSSVDAFEEVSEDTEDSEGISIGDEYSEFGISDILQESMNID